jgi:hypothetical protein
MIQYIGPVTAEHTNYVAVHIRFADNFDLTALPKSANARRLMRIDFTARETNAKNEAGMKRLARILKALDGTPVKVGMPYGNSITAERFRELVA